jgi:predicted methyltransferase
MRQKDSFEINELYREFLQMDKEDRKKALRNSKIPFEYIWDKYFKIDYNVFTELLYIINLYKDLKKIATKANSCLEPIFRILYLLKKKGLITIHEHQINFNYEFFDKDIQRIKSMQLSITLKPLKPNFKLDQYPCSWETSVKRARKIIDDTPTSGRKVLFLGDDDLTSIALGLMSDAEIHVIDCDIRILRIIEKAAKKYGLNITLHKHDLRKELPSNLKNRFDIFISDPPYTLEGITLFTFRGWQALAKEGGERAYICFLPWMLGRKYIKIQKFFLDLGFTIIEIISSFNEYPLLQNHPSFKYLEYMAIKLNIPIHEIVKLSSYSALHVLRLSNQNTHIRKSPKFIKTKEIYSFYPP